MMNAATSMKAAVLAVVAILLTACGGGGNSTEDVNPTSSVPGGATQNVPASASASSMAMVAYLKLLSMVLPEDRDPLTVNGFAPPLPDDTEPESIT